MRHGAHGGAAIVSASPSALPIEAREAAGRLLWTRLLGDPSQEREPDEPESDEADDNTEDDEAA